MNRDFIGALLQLNAEKGVSREQLVHTVEDAIQSAYRRVAPGNEDVHVSSTARPARCASSAPGSSVAEVEDPTTEFTLDEAHAHEPDAELGDLVEIEELDAAHFGRSTRRSPGRSSASGCARPSARPLRRVRPSRERDHHRHRQPGRARGVILDLGKAEAILPTTDQSATGALPHRPARQGVRAGGPAHHPRPAHLRQPHPQELPATPLRAGGARDPRRHRGDQGHRPRGGQPQQDRRLQPAGRARPGRRHGRPARRPRPGRRRRAGRREDRRHPVVRRPGGVRRQRPAARPRSWASRSTRRTASPPSRCPSGCSRWPSAARARTRAWPPS